MGFSGFLTFFWQNGSKTMILNQLWFGSSVQRLTKFFQGYIISNGSARLTENQCNDQQDNQDDSLCKCAYKTHEHISISGYIYIFIKEHEICMRYEIC